jgi:co-chaperonin GroES (HSP10)
LLVPQRFIHGVPPATQSGFDPAAERKKIMAKFPDLKGLQIFGQRVLVATFIRDRLSDNLAVAESTKKEDEWQGKIGLVLAMGHLAFKSDESNDFGPDKVDVGDWVAFSYSDGHNVDYQPPGTFEKVPCKIINDVLIAGKVARPDMFY